MHLTIEQTEEARQWLLDCFPSDDCQARIRDCTPPELERAVNRYFDGGLRAFIETFDLTGSPAYGKLVA